MLQFWYYASLSRHLCIGGLNDNDDQKFIALKKAMILYKKLKPFFTRGTFYGINQTIHLHVDEEQKLGVITAYNLSSRPKRLDMQLDTDKYRLDFTSIDIYNGLNEKLITFEREYNKFIIDIPPMSPIIAVLRK